MRHHQKKFIASHPPAEIRRSRMFLQYPCDSAQDLVTSFMTIAVVDILEAIQVREYHPQRITVARRSSQLPLRPLLDRAAVRQARERIRMAHSQEQFILCVAFALQAHNAAPHS